MRGLLKELRESKSPEQITDESDEGGDPEPNTEELGFLEAQSLSIQSMEEMTEVLTVISSATGEIGPKMNARTTQINNIVEKNLPNQQQLAVGVANAAALDLMGYAEQIGQQVPLLKQKYENLKRSLVPWLTWVKEVSPQQTDDKLQFAAVLETMRLSGTNAIQHVSGFRDSVIGIRNVTASLRKAGDRVQSELDQLIAIMQGLIEVLDESLNLLS